MKPGGKLMVPQYSLEIGDFFSRTKNDGSERKYFKVYSINPVKYFLYGVYVTDWRGKNLSPVKKDCFSKDVDDYLFSEKDDPNKDGFYFCHVGKFTNEGCFDGRYKEENKTKLILGDFFSRTGYGYDGLPEVEEYYKVYDIDNSKIFNYNVFKTNHEGRKVFPVKTDIFTDIVNGFLFGKKKNEVIGGNRFSYQYLGFSPLGLAEETAANEPTESFGDVVLGEKQEHAETFSEIKNLFEVMRGDIDRNIELLEKQKEKINKFIVDLGFLENDVV